MNVKTKMLATGSVLVLFLGFNSCKRTSDEDVMETRDYALGESSYNDLQSISDQAATGDLQNFKSGNSIDGIAAGGCATVTLDTVAMPHTAVVDFGPSNCLCNDNRYRRGIINISFTGKYRDAGTVITITPNGYFVNDNEIAGTKTITNQGLNSDGNMVYHIVVNGEIHKANNGGTVTWTADKTRTWIVGMGTQEWNDDIYLVEGTVSGVSASGNSFTAHTITPLRRQIGCKWFTEGQLSVQKASRPERIIDFGNGTCDANATVTINGNVHNITLP